MNKICPACLATNDKEAEVCEVCGTLLTPIVDYELHRPKAELNIPVGKWVKI